MRYPPVNPKCPHLLHGGDWNPDQWRDVPGILDEDFRLMDLAHANAMSVGIFAWSALEPEEGRYDFGWLDEVMDRLAKTGKFAVLATPSGARPAWMAQTYPEVLRVDAEGRRQHFGERHNHCFTSPVYRAKTREMNRRLAERYRAHPALLLWHVSNEFNGECHCPLCREAFRDWLKARYGSLGALNAAWWTSFWSHAYSDWSQVEPPSPIGENTVHGLKLDWKRFVTAQTIGFFENEAAPLREVTPDVPITTNFMGTFPGLDYFRFAEHVDVVSWDNYPFWHSPAGDAAIGALTGFLHDLNRSLKGGKPFLLMESTPSVTNWHGVPKLKRPGMHLLSSLQAVAHGSDSVQYFQWRKSRGSSEKLHGAVVDHVGTEDTRVFRDVAEVGAALAGLDAVVGTGVRPEVALLYDWENRWALDDAQGLNNAHKDYDATILKHYEAFWSRGVPVDVVSEDGDFSTYRLLVAPMLYMVRPGVAERIEAFVAAGGTFVATYWSGFVGESDLCFLGGFPGPLRRVLGIWDEESDALYDEDEGHVKVAAMGKTYAVKHACDLIRAETAEALATYDADFYAGRPALTANRFGQGRAYFIAFRNNQDFESDFYGDLVAELGLLRALDVELPAGVTAQMRTDGETDFVFVMNFTAEVKAVALPEGTRYGEAPLGAVRAAVVDAASPVAGTLSLAPYGVRVLTRAHAGR